MLTELNYLPAELLDCPAIRLQQLLGSPTLIHLEGRKKQPLFLSVLLHGNETTGWDAIRQYLYQQKDCLPRALSLFIGNVAAAEKSKRHLVEQPDYNRVWRGGDGPEHKMMQYILQQMEKKQVFASIDIHNNTGMNPHYACVNRLDKRFFYLASLFSHKVVYFIRPNEVQSLAFSRLCPAVTVECGQAGAMEGIAHARYFIEKVMAIESFENCQPPEQLALYHTIATIKVPEQFSFVFSNDCEADLCFREDIDTLNFCDLPAGTEIASLNGSQAAHLYAYNEQGKDVRQHFLQEKDGKISTRIALMPAMLTRNREVVRQDCLCYFMERLA